MIKTGRNIYVVGQDKHYCCWMEGTLVDKMEDANLVVFTGGADVSPEMYGEEKHPRTNCTATRDVDEVIMFRKAMELKIPMVGICRGAQLLCVMAGGKLVQHQDNPKFYHKMKTYDDQDIIVTSTHHQAQYPWGLAEDDFRVLGWTTKISKFHENAEQKEMVDGIVPGDIEVEVCHYPHIRGLGIQSHPETQYQRAAWENWTGGSLKWHRALLTMFLEEFPNAK